MKVQAAPLPLRRRTLGGRRRAAGDHPSKAARDAVRAPATQVVRAERNPLAEGARATGVRSPGFPPPAVVAGSPVPPRGGLVLAGMIREKS